jgi:hypothetical protein
MLGHVCFYEQIMHLRCDEGEDEERVINLLSAHMR